MDLFKVGDFYMERIFNSQGRGNGGSRLGAGGLGAPGGSSVLEESRIKVLLLDKDTTPIISMCATQSDLLKHEIYLVDTVENSARDVMRHLKCLVYVRPSDATVDALAAELANPRYGEYHIFFNNAVAKSQLERLAEADVLGAVVKVEEIFQDYRVLSEYLFSLALPPQNLLSGSEGIWSEDSLHSCTAGLTSLLLSLKIRPEIRYDRRSRACHRLAQSVGKAVSTNEKALFDFPRMDAPPCLIVLDRDSDPYTPLLQPWTYQSMINEYIGISRNIVDLSAVPGIDKSLAQVTLSAREDAFFRETRYLNFGELGDRVSSYVNKYKDSAQISGQLESIADIKRFIEKYPEFKRLSGNVAKHMAIVGELDRVLAAENVWALSEAEQNLAVHAHHQGDYEQLLQVLRDPQCPAARKLKLGCLFLLRQDELGETGVERPSEVLALLKESLPAEDINYVHRFRKHFQEYRSRSGNAAEESAAAPAKKDDLLSELTKRFNSKMDLHRRMQGGSTSAAADADNVYMQYVPRLSQLLSDLSGGKLDREAYPSLDGSGSGNATTAPPQDVVLFVVGGVTYEEARFVHEFNETMRTQQQGRTRVVLGGTSTLTTAQYVDSLR